jgi:hypothetical protein
MNPLRLIQKLFGRMGFSRPAASSALSRDDSSPLPASSLSSPGTHGKPKRSFQQQSQRFAQIMKQDQFPLSDHDIRQLLLAAYNPSPNTLPKPSLRKVLALYGKAAVIIFFLSHITLHAVPLPHASATSEPNRISGLFITNSAYNTFLSNK